MYKRNVLLLLMVFLATGLHAQKEDKKLTRQVSDLIKGFNGDIGIYIKNLKNGKTVAHKCRYCFSNRLCCKSAHPCWGNGQNSQG